uniref:Uncharacterized protein n=2 Tax=Clytia hemisphaerica TaxID=252671 RepID=A0A7M5X988_9CNID
MHNAHSQRLVADPCNAAGVREDVTKEHILNAACFRKDLNSDGSDKWDSRTAESINQLYVYKEELKNLKIKNELEKLKLENENLRKDSELKQLELVKDQMQSENEILKLRSENLLLKAEKQYGDSLKVLKNEKLKVEENLKILKAEKEFLEKENVLLKESQAEFVDSASGVERTKFEAELGKMKNEVKKSNGGKQNEEGSFENDNELEILRIENKRLNETLNKKENSNCRLKLEIESLQQENENLKNGFLSSSQMSSDLSLIITLGSKMVFETEKSSNYARWYKTLFDKIETSFLTKDVLIFKIICDRQPLTNLVYRSFRIQDYIKPSDLGWRCFMNLKCVKILHPSDNTKTTILVRHTEATWGFRDNREVATVQGDWLIYLAFVMKE